MLRDDNDVYVDGDDETATAVTVTTAADDDDDLGNNNCTCDVDDDDRGSIQFKLLEHVNCIEIIYCVSIYIVTYWNYDARECERTLMSNKQINTKNKWKNVSKNSKRDR